MYLCRLAIDPGIAMEEWKLDFEWLRIRHWLKDQMGYEQLPGLQGILILIGMQELGQVSHAFTKEEKQDLMHIAVCSLLSKDGYYELAGLDEDGWPHFELQRPIPALDVESQEKLLKEKIVSYFVQYGVEIFSKN